MLKEIVIAIQSYLEAHRFIVKHRLWKWILITGIVYALLFFASLYCIQIQRLKLFGYLFFWLSFLGKFSMILCFPILLYYWYENYGLQWRTFFQILAINIFIILTLIFGLFIHFQNLDMIVEPLNIVNNLWPTGTFLSYFYELFNAMKLTHLKEWTTIFKILFKSLFAIYVGFLFFFIMRKSCQTVVQVWSFPNKSRQWRKRSL